MLSERVKDLRQLKVKKEIFLNKLMDKCDSDWRNSQLSMVIQTTVYKIENSIDELLQCNDTLCKYAAILVGASSYLHEGKYIPHAHQGNFVCFNTESEEDSTLIKQRSDIWFSKRKEAIVTGSTINTAIALDGLKRQKQLLEVKAGKRTEDKITPDLQQKFDHETKHKINAVATLVSKILPAFNPDSSFFEEECYMEKEAARTVLVVSPDGSIRRTDDEKLVLCRVEIKYPYPGKTFTTPVHYGIPHYYVPHVPSEMYSLGVDSLLFLSYSEESMTVHRIDNDKVLWEDIFAEIKLLDHNRIPKKLSASRISEFCRSRVHLLAEVSSCFANPCDHSSSMDTGRIYHEGRQERDHPTVQLKDILKILLKCKELVRVCHEICTQRASEVLVFLVADLDLTYKAEIPHAFPIGFALKGYSMKTDTMRKMLQDVLLALFIRGMYTPVISYDGQWAKLAFQNENGEPLTMLELQKKVASEVQKRSVKDICDQIFQTGLVKLQRNEDVVRELHRKTRFSNRDYVQATNSSPICKCGIVHNRVCETTEKSEICREPKKGNIDEILSNITSDVISQLEESTVECLSTIDYSTERIDHTRMSTSDLLLDSTVTPVPGEIPMSVVEEDIDSITLVSSDLTLNIRLMFKTNILRIVTR